MKIINVNDRFCFGLRKKNTRKTSLGEGVIHFGANHLGRIYNGEISGEVLNDTQREKPQKRLQ